MKDKKKGSFKGSSLAKSSLLNLEAYATLLAERAADEISDGFITPCPDETACSRCNARGVCLYDKTRGFRQKGKVAEDDIVGALKGGENE